MLILISFRMHKEHIGVAGPHIGDHHVHERITEYQLFTEPWRYKHTKSAIHSSENSEMDLERQQVS